MVWCDDRWITDPTASKDSVVARAAAEVYDRLVRQTYRVLLTRDRARTVLYSTDPWTRVKLRQLLDKQLLTGHHSRYGDAVDTQDQAATR